jgi:hypothetical protein
MAAALGYLAHGSAARLCFHLQQPSYNTDRLIAVLEQLAGFYAGQRAARSSWLQTRRMPCSVASATSARVVVGRFASSTSLRLAHRYSTGLSSGRRPAAARRAASRAGCPGRPASWCSSGPTAHPR